MQKYFLILHNDASSSANYFPKESMKYNFNYILIYFHFKKKIKNSNFVFYFIISFLKKKYDFILLNYIFKLINRNKLLHNLKNKKVTNSMTKSFII